MFTNALTSRPPDNCWENGGAFVENSNFVNIFDDDDDTVVDHSGWFSAIRQNVDISLSSKSSKKLRLRSRRVRRLVPYPRIPRPMKYLCAKCDQVYTVFSIA